MRTILFFAVLILCAAGAHAQKQQFISANIKRASITMLGGSLTVNAVRGSQYSYVEVSGLRVNECHVLVNLNSDKELVVHVQRMGANSDCSANINIGLPERAAVSISAYGTSGNISNFRRSLFLDLRQSNFNVRGFRGGIDLVSHNSDVSAEGFFREVLLDSSDGARTFLNWAQNPQHMDIEISGGGEIYFTFPKQYDIKKVPVDNMGFNGLLLMKNR